MKPQSPHYLAIGLFAGFPTLYAQPFLYVDQRSFAPMPSTEQQSGFFTLKTLFFNLFLWVFRNEVL